jgi:lipopolysaccharide export system permease protein
VLSIAQRYLAYHFIPPFTVSCLFFVGFLLTFQLFRILELVINKGVDFWTVLALTGHIAVSFLPTAIPLSVLIATIYTLNKLCEDSEIVAMRSFGMSKREIFYPYFVMGVTIAIGIFALNRSLIPASQTKFKNTIVKLTSRGMLADISSENFFTEIPGVTLFADEVKTGGTQLIGVFIHNQIGKDSKIITAKRGALIKQYSGDFNIPSIRLHLKNGVITKTKDLKKGTIENIHFEEYDFPLMDDNFQPGFVARDSMRSSRELSNLVTNRKRRLKEFKKKSTQKSLTPEELAERREILRVKAKTELEYWTRINTPFQVLVFILIGFTMGIKKGRGRTKNTGMMSFGILLAYYIIFFAGVSLAQKGKMSTSLVVFIPTFLVTIISGYFYKKLDWQG